MGSFRCCLVFAIAVGSTFAAEVRVPQDHPTVAAAVAAAEDGDTIVLQSQ